MEIYYNREEFGVLDNYEQLVERVVESLLDQGRTHCQNTKTSKSKKKQNGIDKINTHALLTIVLTANAAKSEGANKSLATKQDNHNHSQQYHHSESSTEIFAANKKIEELLGPVDNSVVNIIFDKSYLPEKYKIISSIEKLRKAYEEVYEKILKKQPQLRTDKDKIKEEEEDDDEELSENEEEDDDEIQESEGPRKKFKGNNIEQEQEFSSNNSSNHLSRSSNKDPKENSKNSQPNSKLLDK